MKNLFLFFALALVSISLQSQTLDAEKQYLNERINSEKLNKEQVVELGLKWNDFITTQKYPSLPINIYTGEVEFTDLLIFDSLPMQAIFQRCMQWLALNYQDVVYHDMEAGKIIANGSVNLTHTAEIKFAFAMKESAPTQTAANYTMVLTFKENRVKYQITKIDYRFTNYSSTISEISILMKDLFPIVTKDPIQWERYITVLTESNRVFDYELKKEISDYIQAIMADYSF